MFLDISQQRIQLQKLIQDNPESVVVSMDKFLPTEHNLDASRVYDSETSKYLFHNIKLLYLAFSLYVLFEYFASIISINAFFQSFLQ